MLDTHIQTEATLQRTRLLLGITKGAAVVEWADAQLLALADSPSALTDVSLTDPHDLTALRLALAPLAIDPEPRAIIEQILREVAADLLGERRSTSDTASVLRQMRSMLRVPLDIDASLDELIDPLMLAEVGIGYSVAEASARVQDWARAMIAQTAH